MSERMNERIAKLEHAAITVTDHSVTISIADARETEEPKGYMYGPREAHTQLLWWTRKLVELRDETFAEERREREEGLARAKLAQQAIFELLTKDELRALNAAGLGGAVSRIAAGLVSAEGDVRLRVDLPREES